MSIKGLWWVFKISNYYNILPACSRVWSAGLSVSRIERDIKSSWCNFCFPKATAPLVTIIHSLPSIWHSATCSTIDAKRPKASPCSSSLVITALPNFTTNRRAYLSWLLSVNVPLRGRSAVWCSRRMSNRLLYNHQKKTKNKEEFKEIYLASIKFFI